MLLRAILLAALAMSLAGCAGLNEGEKTMCYKPGSHGKGGQMMVARPC
jgi:hypothetical protein